MLERSGYSEKGILKILIDISNNIYYKYLRQIEKMVILVKN